MREPETRDYLCCGLRVRSAVRLPWEEVTAGGDADVTVAAGTIQTRPRPAAEARFEGTGVILDVPAVGRFRARGGSEVVIDIEPGASDADVLLYLCGSVFGAIWLQRGLLPLHASTVANRFASVAFVGLSGAGKSSLAAHLAELGWTMVADDVSVIRPLGDALGIWAGSGRVKLARDAVASIDHEVEALPHVGGTREKYHVPLRAADAGFEPVPLRRIYLLAGWGDRVAAEPASGLDAIDIVGGHTYRQEFVKPLGLEPGWLRQVVRVARTVPVFRLIRPRGFEHTGEVARFILDHLAEGS
jgi:hypothetical protein